MEMKAKEVASILKIIANANRLMILCILEEGEYSVGELGEKINDITLPALSQHLSALRLAGFIESDKKGLNVYYRISDQRIIEVIKVLKVMYCQED
ncbi:MAG: ArsR/SmtB family transcription factor [Beduini sp.]|uniref:ArsR/SmtB family transcription factor n=1 Tax=Beduini sp. TaxID=1922300 RepID=UPI0039A3740F